MASVVVENVGAHSKSGRPPRDATIKQFASYAGPIIGPLQLTLVGGICFRPFAFFPGHGTFFTNSFSP